MNNNSASETTPGDNEATTTGLPWPKTWNGAYLFVIATFIFWLLLLIGLTEFGK